MSVEDDSARGPRLSRRAFIAAAGGAAAATLPLSSGCGDSSAVETAPQGAALAAMPAFTFTDAQRRALSAAVAQLIPAEGPGDWNAADAGAVEYIELLLNSFSGDGNPKIYAHGPSRERFGEFQPLSRVKAHGWQQEVQRLRGVYAQGLDELNRLARGPLSVLSGDFAALPGPAQELILRALDQQNTPFFAALFAHTMEGVYGPPVYGGNRDAIAWRSLCYAGDVHGVRFPEGRDPLADDRPWNRYGGYSPEEIARPGDACIPGASDEPKT